MVKSLVDACLLKIEENISYFNRLGRELSRKHKEILIERLCWHRRLTPHSISTVAQHLFVPALLRLNLSHSDQVDDKLLEEVAECGCYPEYITIRNCPKVTGKGICCIARMTKRAEEITLQDLRNIDSSCLVDFGSPFVSHLTLEGCTQITDIGVIAVLKKCINVRVLNISWLHQLTDESITALAKKLNFKLEELDAAGLNHVTCDSTSALAQHCPRLRRANFEACNSLNGCGIVEMATNCKLEELNLSHCCHISDDMVQEIVSQTRFRCSVTRLNMHGVYLSQDAFDMTVTLPHLRVLELFDTERVNDTTLRRICLAVGSRLMELSISRCYSLTEKACQSVGKHCCLLKKLSFEDLPQLTGVGLQQLLEDRFRANQLLHLQVSRCEKFDRGVIQLSATRCCNLHTLLLEALSGVDDEIVCCIAHNLPKLQRLSLRNCSYTDVGICEVAKHCSQLRMLALDGNCSLTDRGVRALAENCPCLNELYLLGSDRVSQAAVEHIVRRCTNCVHLVAPATLSEELVVKDLDSGRYVRVDELLQSRHATLSP